MINHYCYTWIEEWCNEHGWTDLFVVKRNEYWAFPPHGVMPLPIPQQTLSMIKRQQGMSPDERRWCISAVLLALLAAVSSYAFQSPMPLVAAFSCCAFVAAQFEADE